MYLMMEQVYYLGLGIGFLDREVSKLKIFFSQFLGQISDDFSKFTSNFQLLKIPKNSVLSTIRYYNRYMYDNILYNNRLFAHHCPCCCCKILFFKCQKRNAFCEEQANNIVKLRTNDDGSCKNPKLDFWVNTPKILKMKCNKWPFEQNFYSYFAKYLAKFVDFSNFQSAFHWSVTVSTQVCQIFAKKLPHKNSFLYIYFQISKPGFFNYPIIYITTLGHF